jgi:transcriptional antiterminator RfaH
MSKVGDDHWFLAQTKPRAESEAQLNLERQGFSVCLPMCQQSVRMTQGYRKQVMPMFPGYIFLQLNDVISSWYSVRSTRGVSRLVVFGEDPARISHDMVSLIQAQSAMSLLDEKPQAGWRAGDRAEVFHGAFSGYEGVVQSVDSNERITLLLRYAAAFTRLTLSPEYLKKVIV